MSPLLLHLSHNPDAIVAALLAGILLIYFECNRPGAVVPGCLGCLLVLLSLHRLSQLPVNLFAILFCILGVTLILLEAFVATSKLLLCAGIVALVYGLGTLVELSVPEHVHIMTALIIAITFGVTTDWLATIALRARRNKRSNPHPAATQDRLKQSRVPGKGVCSG